MKDHFTRAKDALAEQRIRSYNAQQEQAKQQQPASAPALSQPKVK